jgi:hypothetical protein
MCDARSRGTEDWCEPAISLRLSGWTQEGTGMYTWLSMAWVQCTWDHYQLLHSRLSPHQAQTTKSCCCILMETLHLVLVQSGDQPLGPAFTDSVAPSPLMCIWGKEEKGSQELTMCSSFIGGIKSCSLPPPSALCTSLWPVRSLPRDSRWLCSDHVPWRWGRMKGLYLPRRWSSKWLPSERTHQGFLMSIN